MRWQQWRVAVMAAAAVSLATAFAACGDSSDGSSGSTATDNAASSTTGTSGAGDSAELSHAREEVAKFTARQTTWTGPTSGPKCEPGKFVVLANFQNASPSTKPTADAVHDAAKFCGWRVHDIDGQGTVAGQESALRQAIALKPDGIILQSFDIETFKNQIKEATSKGIKVVDKNGGLEIGPIGDVSANVGVSGEELGRAQADFVIDRTDGKANAVIINDPAFAAVRQKAQAARDELAKCSTCTLLAFKSSPIVEASTQFGPLTASLLQTYGSKLNAVITPTDYYWNFAVPVLKRSGLAPDAIVNINGDGNVDAFQRIETGDYEAGTVPLPLAEHGYQLVDEMNRALHGEPWSGYVPQAHIVVKENIQDVVDGFYVPPNGFKEEYEKIWKGGA